MAYLSVRTSGRYDSDFVDIQRAKSCQTAALAARRIDLAESRRAFRGVIEFVRPATSIERRDHAVWFDARIQASQTRD